MTPIPGLDRIWQCWFLALALAGPVFAEQAYRGFALDESAVRGESDLAAILSATREQIDLVHAVGAPAEVLAFFESVKFKLVPAGTFRSSTPGLYAGRGERSVQVSAAIVNTGHKPVLLHELLHAYHDRQVEHGFANRVILDLFAQARSIPAFAAKSHMMSNEKEYFACTATAYLFGVTAQEPFSRSKIRENQPAAYDYLKKLFGPEAGRYEGSLTR